MKRTTYLAEVTDSTGQTLEVRNTSAWNSAIRATEAILRELGRSSVGALEGAPAVVVGKPGTAGATYTRTWTTSSGREYRALVREAV